MLEFMKKKLKGLEKELEYDMPLGRALFIGRRIALIRSLIEEYEEAQND